MSRLIYGIDEAALGPILGPFCVALTTFHCQDCAPDVYLYKVLENSIAALSDTSGRTVLADSKQIYSPSKGIRQLEHCVAVLLNSAGLPFPHTFRALMQLFCPLEDCNNAKSVAWFGDKMEIKLPISSLDWTAVNNESENIRQNMAEQGIRFEIPKLRMITAFDFNRLLKISAGKADAVQKIVGSLFKPILHRCLWETCRIAIDRQGGRKFYGGWLCNLLPGAPINTLHEGKTRSAYTLGSSVIEFTVAADKKYLETAIASMFAKYLREVSMHCFNHWWTARIPDIKPTAGYPKDARRFIRQVNEAEMLPWDRDLLVRRL